MTRPCRALTTATWSSFEGRVGDGDAGGAFGDAGGPAADPAAAARRVCRMGIAMAEAVAKIAGEKDLEAANKKLDEAADLLEHNHVGNGIAVARSRCRSAPGEEDQQQREKD